jgi:hypothetical protein
VRFFLVAVFAIRSLYAANPGAGDFARVAVVLDFEQQNPEKLRQSLEVIRSMQVETASVLRDSGLTIDWATMDESSRRQDFGEVVVFKMRGKCAMDSFPLLPDELGLPLAVTHSSDGEILSFGAIDCDRVRNSLKRTMTGRDYARGDTLLGRALGRVMAHEMYHMLARSIAHASEGVTRECLSARELVRDRLMLSDKSLKAIREQMALLKKRDGASRPTSDRAIPPASSLP